VLPACPPERSAGGLHHGSFSALVAQSECKFTNICEIQKTKRKKKLEISFNQLFSTGLISHFLMKTLPKAVDIFLNSRRLYIADTT
jgi:hypothetical protein